MASETTDRVYGMLPAFVREADGVNGKQLYAFISLALDQLDEVVKRLDAISYFPPDDGGTPGDSSALVDATQAGVIGDAKLHLLWLSQLLGVRLNTADSLPAQIDAVRYATNGWRAGTRAALADAARSVLTGTKYVLIEPHYAGDPWAINIRTRASETPSSAAVINAILAKGAKPAGVVLLNEAFSASWNVIEAARPNWEDWDGSTWREIEETGAPDPDSGNIPDPDQGNVDPGEATNTFSVSSAPQNQIVGWSLSGLISFEFTKAINPASANPIFKNLTTGELEEYTTDTAQFEVEGNTIYGLAVTRTVSGSATPLEPANTYSITFKSGPTGLLAQDGSMLAADFTTQFSTIDVPLNPDVANVAPAVNATGVVASTTPAVVVKMNTLLDDSCITTTNFVVAEAATGTAVARTLSTEEYDAGGFQAHIVTITFDDPIKTGTQYRVTVLGDGSTGVQSLDTGNYMLANFSSIFATAGSPPVVTTGDPPTVASTNPAKDQVNAASSAEIAVRFSKSMKPGTFTPSSVELKTVGGAVIPTDVTYDTTRNRISIAPTNPILPGTKYQVTLGTAIQSTDGVALAAPFVYQWTTAGSTSTGSGSSGGPDPSKWQETWFDDFKTPVLFINDYKNQATPANVNAWAYDGISTWQAGTFRRSHLKTDTSGTGIFEIHCTRNSAEKDPAALSDMIAGGCGFGYKAQPAPAFFETRVRIDKGAGFGAAILTWPSSNRWPIDNEGDMLETPHGDRLSGIVNWHYGDPVPGGNPPYKHFQSGQGLPGPFFPQGIDFSQWHVLRHEWLSNRVTFYIDNIKVKEITDPAAIETLWPTGPDGKLTMYLCFQVDMGKAGMNWIDLPSSSTPALVKLQVDWVRQGKYIG